MDLGVPVWHKIIRMFLRHKISDEVVDTAVWNTNALRTFSTIDDIDLHVIFTHSKMRKSIQRFKDSNINYYAVNGGDTLFRTFFLLHIKPERVKYKKTWGIITNVVNELQPDIIHIMGAENPQYSLSILQLPKTIPIIVQLQTLLNDPDLIKYRGSRQYKPKINCEYKVLQRGDFIGTASTIFRQKIRQIKQDAVFVNTRLLIAEDLDMADNNKCYDFVYFANYIHKAIDLAIEAFALICKKRAELTLDVIGGASAEELRLLDKRLKELGISANVTIEGKLPTHDDVLKQIKKARFALLPLKTDMVSGTIREAMWSGLPVVSTITQGTPFLNEKRESILLSEIGDYEAMAKNMARLIDDENLVKLLRSNAAITVEERYGGNTDKAKEWVLAYRACIENFHNGTPLPDNVVNKN